MDCYKPFDRLMESEPDCFFRPFSEASRCFYSVFLAIAEFKQPTPIALFA
jgi:hypothetical protein